MQMAIIDQPWQLQVHPPISVLFLHQVLSNSTYNRWHSHQIYNHQTHGAAKNKLTECYQLRDFEHHGNWGFENLISKRSTAGLEKKKSLIPACPNSYILLAFLNELVSKWLFENLAYGASGLYKVTSPARKSINSSCAEWQNGTVK